VAVRDSAAESKPAAVRIFLASSNQGKLREYRELADGTALAVELFPGFREISLFEESALTFAEIAAGKALHYSRFTDGLVLADDSGLMVPALGGAPGVHSARYAGPHAADADCVRKLLGALQGGEGNARRARFVCVTAIARPGRALAVVSDLAEGLIAMEQRGTNGFGYDPVFFFPQIGRTFAEASSKEKNLYSHRGKAFRKVVRLLVSPNSMTLP
jgi:XTP/dITP diphosphohydrolase